MMQKQILIFECHVEFCHKNKRIKIFLETWIFYWYIFFVLALFVLHLHRSCLIRFASSSFLPYSLHLHRSCLMLLANQTFLTNLLFIFLASCVDVSGLWQEVSPYGEVTDMFTFDQNGCHGICNSQFKSGARFFSVTTNEVIFGYDSIPSSISSDEKQITYTSNNGLVYVYKKLEGYILILSHFFFFPCFSTCVSSIVGFSQRSLQVPLPHP